MIQKRAMRVALRRAESASMAIPNTPAVARMMLVPHVVKVSQADSTETNSLHVLVKASCPLDAIRLVAFMPEFEFDRLPRANAREQLESLATEQLSELSLA